MNVEGMMKLEKSPFGKHHFKINPRKEHSWMPNLVGKSRMKNWILHNLKVSPHKIFTNFKKKSQNFTMEKPDENH